MNDIAACPADSVYTPGRPLPGVDGPAWCPLPVQLVLIERRQRQPWSHRGITGLRGRAEAARSRSSGCG